jgi:signal transduction histidine kinase
VDITDLKQSQQKLQRLHDRLRKMSAQMALSEQHHRQRVAQDLHDHVGQNLAVVMVLLQKLQARIPEDQAEAIGQALDRVEQVSRTTRDLTSQLFPAVLRQLGLAAGVEWVAESVLKPHRIALQIGSDLPEENWPAEVCSVLWRSVRELLVNVVKHAEARSVRIEMDRQERGWVLRIADDGVGLGGMNQQQLEDAGQGMGLFSVRQGLEHLGGRLELRQAAGGGTEAWILLPPCGQQGTK